MSILDGALFYLVFWSLWVYVTFILSRQNPYRFQLAAMILTIIIFSNYSFSIGNFEIYSSGVLMLLFCYFFISQQKRISMIYQLICSLIISVAYVSFHLFEIFDPVWIIFNKDWMLGVCLGFLAITLQKSLKERLLIVVSGTMQGELLYAYTVSKFQFPSPIGALAYLDVCSLVIVLLMAWSFLENAGTIFQQYFQFMEKGKQKSS